MMAWFYLIPINANSKYINFSDTGHHHLAGTNKSPSGVRKEAASEQIGDNTTTEKKTMKVPVATAFANGDTERMEPGMGKKASWQRINQGAVNGAFGAMRWRKKEAKLATDA